MKRILCALLFVFGLLTSAWADGSRYASESVLSSEDTGGGRWYLQTDGCRSEEDGLFQSGQSRCLWLWRLAFG